MFGEEISHTKKEKLKKVKSSFESLNLPFFFIRGHDIENVKEAFIRLNCKGTPLKTADKALAYACDIRLRDKLNNFKEGLRSIGFGDIDNSSLADAIVFCKGIDDVSEKTKENLIRKLNKESDAFDEEWKTIRNSIGKAIDHLTTSFKVNHSDLLPSKTMIPILTVFFYENNNRNPDNIQSEEIKKWFWVSALTGRYSGRLYRRSILEDIRRMKGLAKSHKKLGLHFDKIDIDELVRADFSKKNATITRAYFCLLANQEPLYLENAEKINIADPAVILDKKHRHHIFPKSSLMKIGIPARKYNSIVNICYLPLQENAAIGNNLPCDYLSRYRNNHAFAKIMKSHLFPFEKGSAIWRSDAKVAFKQFLDERKISIADAFENVASATIFER